MPKPIRVSLVASTDSTFEVVRRSIELLTDQTIREEIELILTGPDLETMQPDLEVLSKFGSYQIVEVREFETTGASMAAGFKKAKGEFLIYIEEHGFPPADFAEKVIETFDKTGADVVGYGLVPSNPGMISWAHIFIQFGAVVPPQPSGFKQRLGPHHVSYRAGVLSLNDAGVNDVMSNEAVLHETLYNQGLKMYYNGEIFVYHAQISDFSQLVRHEFFSGVTYAHARHTSQNWSVWRRALYVLGSPLIPFWRTGRAIVDMNRCGRLWKLLPWTPFVMLTATISGTLGEIVGYIFGKRKWIADRRSEFELDRFAFVNSGDQLNAPRTAEQARQLR